MSDRFRGLWALTPVVFLVGACTGEVGATYDDDDAGVGSEQYEIRGHAWGRFPRPRSDAGTDAGSVVTRDAGPATSDAGPARVDAGPGSADAGSGSADAGSGGGSSTGIASLGPMPAEMAGLRWPEAPRITREVTVRTTTELQSAVSVAGTRVRVVGAVGGSVSISVNDIEILADSATSIGRLSINRSVSRVHIVGGTYTDIYLAIPGVFYPSTEFRSEWMVNDVLIDGVRVSSSNMAFEIRGRRIAIVNSRTTAARYSVWCGDTGAYQSEDIILHNNVFDSAGPEATVRLVQVLRSATIGNTLVNTLKHNYRIHGVSDLNYARGNLLVNTGVMLGRMAGDDLGRVWFDDNVLHHTAPDLFNPDAGIDMLHATGNLAYTNVWGCFYCGGVQPGWVVSSNTIRTYTPPPAY